MREERSASAGWRESDVDNGQPMEQDVTNPLRPSNAEPIFAGTLAGGPTFQKNIQDRIASRAAGMPFGLLGPDARGGPRARGHLMG